MRRALLIALALLTGCAIAPSRVTTDVYRKDGCLFWTRDDEPVKTAAGKPWCDPPP